MYSYRKLLIRTILSFNSMRLWAFSLYFANFIFVIHFSVLPHLKTNAIIILMGMVKGKTIQRLNLGHSMIWIQPLMPLSRLRYLTDKSSTCVYTAFRAAFSLVSLMGCLRSCLWMSLLTERKYFSSALTNMYHSMSTWQQHF